MQPFPPSLPFIYKTAPCRNYTKSTHSHVKTTGPGTAKVMNMLIYLMHT